MLANPLSESRFLKVTEDGVFGSVAKPNYAVSWISDPAASNIFKESWQVKRYASAQSCEDIYCTSVDYYSIDTKGKAQGSLQERDRPKKTKAICFGSLREMKRNGGCQPKELSGGSTMILGLTCRKLNIASYKYIYHIGSGVGQIYEELEQKDGSIHKRTRK
ncbi:hypothetical protein Tco_0555641 [Tanacetum coccineum]